MTAGFDGARLTSDGGDMLLSLAERRLRIAARLARYIPDCNGMRITCIFVIGFGSDDADDVVYSLMKSRILAEI